MDRRGGAPESPRWGGGDVAPRHRKLLGAPPNPDHPPACCPREFQAVCVNLAQRLTRSRCPPPRHHPAPLIRTLRYPPPPSGPGDQPGVHWAPPVGGVGGCRALQAQVPEGPTGRRDWPRRPLHAPQARGGRARGCACAWEALPGISGLAARTARKRGHAEGI